MGAGPKSSEPELAARARQAILSAPASMPAGISVHADQEQPSRERDFYAWLLHQANELRSRKPDFLDWVDLAEELEEMARSERDALVSDLEVALRHMLKLTYEVRPTQRHWRERQWKLDLAEHRNRVHDRLEGSGTLNSKFEELKVKAYERARKLAGIAIDPSQNPVGPTECPWSKEQILDDNFFPDAVSGRDVNGHSR